MPGERTVHIVDDDAAVRRSLERLLDSMEFATVSYPTPEEFLLAAPRLSEGCVLLDVKMPGIGGPEVQARLIGLGFFLPIIVITGQGNGRGLPDLAVNADPFTGYLLYDPLATPNLQGG